MGRADHDRGDRAVEMSDLAVGVPEAGAVCAVNALGLGGKIPRGVQGQKAGAAHRAHGLQQTGLLEALMEVVEEAEQAGWLNRVERLADVIVGRNALDLEQGTGVVAPGSLFHVLLETEERGTLGEEDGQGRGGNIGQVMEAVVPRAPIRQSGGDSTPALDKMIETVARVHPHQQCRNGTKSTSYNRVTKVANR